MCLTLSRQIFAWINFGQLRFSKVFEWVYYYEWRIYFEVFPKLEWQENMGILSKIRFCLQYNLSYGTYCFAIMSRKCKTPVKVFLFVNFSKNFKISFLTEYFWMATSNFFSTSIHWNIHVLYCLVGMCISIKDWLGEKWKWNCNIRALEREMWEGAIGQSVASERNCKEQKRMVDWTDD